MVGGDFRTTRPAARSDRFGWCPRPTPPGSIGSTVRDGLDLFHPGASAGQREPPSMTPSARPMSIWTRPLLVGLLAIALLATAGVAVAAPAGTHGPAAAQPSRAVDAAAPLVSVPPTSPVVGPTETAPDRRCRRCAPDRASRRSRPRRSPSQSQRHPRSFPRSPSRSPSSSASAAATTASITSGSRASG